MSTTDTRFAVPAAAQGTVLDEFAGADLNDARLSSRLEQLVRSVTLAPGLSFPRALATERELEGFYRFMSNERISPEELARPHLEASVARACEADEALCVHDTSQFAFSHAQEVMGKLPGSKRGFLGHFSLLLRDEVSRLPLGLGTLMAWKRADEPKSRSATGHKLSSRQIAQRGNRESDRWLRCIEKVEERAQGEVSLIHVADQECDSYELISQVVERGRRFVFRIGRDRPLDGECDESLLKRLNTAPIRCERTVNLSRRKASTAPKSARRHPSRAERRRAKLAISVLPIIVKRPQRRPDLAETVSINVVRVHEVEAPEGQAPVEWLLATTEPIQTEEQILRIVDLYRARWTIEEFFKALKTGCQFTKRQLESYEGLLKVLALFLPIAWQMLLVRQLPREDPDLPASLFLAPLQLTVLLAVSPIPLPEDPTIAQVARAIARMGGHVKSNGPPGWLTLARGTEALAQNVTGWIACTRHVERTR